MNDILKFDKPGKSFEEALLLGNGFLGAAVYGGIKTERYSLNEATLWSGYPHRSVLPTCKEAYFKARELCQKGEIAEATRLLEENFQGDFSQVYLPFCNFFIESPLESAEEYSRSLDMSKGVCRVEYKNQNAYILR